MGKPAAKKGDQIVGVDQHTMPGPPPQPLTFPFLGDLSGGLSNNVNIQKSPAATKGSTAFTKVSHPNASNLGTINEGSQTVFINHIAAARDGDSATTCDELGRPGKVKATGAVLIGD
jgi:uncharacterized Zn-binding protein involved in type VI secretion